jgi:hypothetical protein
MHSRCWKRREICRQDRLDFRLDLGGLRSLVAVRWWVGGGVVGGCVCGGGGGWVLPVPAPQHYAPARVGNIRRAGDKQRENHGRWGRALGRPVRDIKTHASCASVGTTQRTKHSGFLALPAGGPEICQQHRRRSQRRIWGQELAPSRPQPPATGGTDGIQPAAGSPTTPGRCRSAHARTGKVVLGLVYRSAGSNIPAAQYHGPAVFWAIARENGIEPNSLGGL